MTRVLLGAVPAFFPAPVVSGVDSRRAGDTRCSPQTQQAELTKLRARSGSAAADEAARRVAAAEAEVAARAALAAAEARAAEADGRAAAADARAVSRPFPSWNRSILTEIFLCHACSCQEILRTETAGQAAAERRVSHAVARVRWQSATAKALTLRRQQPQRTHDEEEEDGPPSEHTVITTIS
eukprot:COSAG01_NODE_2388_length_7779_cov_127.916384_13_plen_183_part_00